MNVAHVPPQILRGCSQVVTPYIVHANFSSIPRQVHLVLLVSREVFQLFGFFNCHYCCITLQHLHKLAVWVVLSRVPLGGNYPEKHFPKKVTFKRSKTDISCFFFFFKHSFFFKVCLSFNFCLLRCGNKFSYSSRLPRARCIGDGHAPRKGGEKMYQNT